MSRKDTIDIDYIARKLGMAKSSVSKALNDRADVSTATKEKVRKAAKELNYVPSYFAKAIKLKKSNLIGVVMHEMRHEFFVEIARSVTKAARARGYNAVFATSEGSSDAEESIITDFISRRIDGLIIIPCINGGTAFLKEVAPRHPCVIVDNYLKDARAPFVGTDFAEGAYIAVRHLIDIGHRRIGYIGGPSGLASSPERVAGYKRAFQDADLSYEEEWLASGAYDSAAAKPVFETLFKRSPGMTAVLCANVDIAEGVREGIEGNGMRIPDDISLMDFGGGVNSGVDQQNEQVGRMAVEILHRVINKQEVPGKSIITPTLALRRSTRPLTS